MRRKLFALNLALVALIAAAGWRIRQQWLEGSARERRAAPMKPVATPATPPGAVQPPQPVTAASYAEVAQQMLFTPDRNPDVVVEVAPPKPLPPLPVAHGVVNFGDGPVVILSEKQGSPHRSYSPGEKVGEFTLVAVNTEEIELDFEGQKLRKKLSELKERQESAPAPSTSASAPRADVRVEAAAAAPEVMQTRIERPAGGSGPGREIAGGRRACQPGDPSPAGTILNGFRKIVAKTPFGEMCRWEPVQ